MAQVTDAWQQLSAHTGVPIKGKFPTESEIEEMVDRSMRLKRDERSAVMEAKVSDFPVDETPELHGTMIGWCNNCGYRFRLEEGRPERVYGTYLDALVCESCANGNARLNREEAVETPWFDVGEIPDEERIIKAKVSDMPLEEPSGYKVEFVACDELKESGVTPEVEQVVRDFQHVHRQIFEPTEGFTEQETDTLALELLKLAYQEKEAQDAEARD